MGKGNYIIRLVTYDHYCKEPDSCGVLKVGTQKVRQLVLSDGYRSRFVDSIEQALKIAEHSGGIIPAEDIEKCQRQIQP